MSQCTHLIVFSGADGTLSWPEEIEHYQHIRVVSEAWVERCFYDNTLVDDTPFLLRPLPTQHGMSKLLFSFIFLDDIISYHIPNSQYLFEWENNIKESVDVLFEGVSPDCHQTFSVRCTPFGLPSRAITSSSSLPSTRM